MGKAKTTYEKLTLWADYLETEVTEDHFNMHVYAETMHPCNSAGCAAGYLPSIPYFYKKGLRLVQDGMEFVPMLKGFGHKCSRSLETILGITAGELDWIVMPGGYITKGQRDNKGNVLLESVIARIRDVAEKYKIEQAKAAGAFD